VLAQRQRARVVGQVQQQRVYIHPFLALRIVATLEARQHQQVVYQLQHTVRLLHHQPNVAARLFRGHHRRLAHVLQKAVDHGERRAQLVRHIGDEIAARGVGTLDLRNVETHQQLAFGTEGYGL
jgi:hypothetical protein